MAEAIGVPEHLQETRTVRGDAKHCLAVSDNYLFGSTIGEETKTKVRYKKIRVRRYSKNKNKNFASVASIFSDK